MKSSLFIGLISAVFALGFSSCKVLPPTFRGVQNVKFEKVGAAGVQFNSEAVFYNPNRVRLKVSDLAVDVLLADKNVATLGKKTNIVVKRNTEFRIPLGGALNVQGSLQDNLGSLLKIFTNKQLSFAIKGDIKFKTLCFLKYHIPIQYEQKVNLGQIK